MALYTYSPADITVTIAGLHIVGGYVDGTFIRLIKNTKPFETQRAMDGEIARMYSQDESYTLELTLAQSSPSNNVLSAIHNIDTVTRRGKFPLALKDGRGQTSFFSLTSWIDSIPEIAYGNEMSDRVWRIGCAQAALVIGGNGSTSAIEDTLLTGSSYLPILKEFGIIGG